MFCQCKCLCICCVNLCWRHQLDLPSVERQVICGATAQHQRVLVLAQCNNYYSVGPEQTLVAEFSSGSIVIVVNAAPSVNVSASSSSICAGASSDSYCEWSVKLSLEQWRDINDISVSPSATTTYSVTGTNASGCSVVISKTITVNVLPSVMSLHLLRSICAGASTTLTASGASTYCGAMVQRQQVSAVSPKCDNDLFLYRNKCQWMCCGDFKNHHSKCSSSVNVCCFRFFNLCRSIS